MDNSQGFIRIPIEMNIEFQRAFSPSFDRLPIENPSFQRGALCKGWLSKASEIQK